MPQCIRSDAIDLLIDEKRTLLGLLDIIYSYAYDFRTTLGEGNVESAWTVTKISPTLSWFDVCIRRNIC